MFLALFAAFVAVPETAIEKPPAQSERNLPAPPPRAQAEAKRSMPPAELFNRSVKPRGNLAAVLSNEDYPLDAMRNSEQGTVSFVLTLDERGRVADCIIEYSSGSASLDAQTCRLMWLRAKLEPGRDKAGRPVTSAMHARIRWVLPEPDPIPIVPWTSTMTWKIDREGQLKSCDVTNDEIFSNDPTDNEDCNDAAAAPGDVRRLLREGSNQEIATVVLESRFIPGERSPSMRPGEGHGEVLLYREAVSIMIGTDGKTSDCRTIERSGPLPAPQIDPCKSFIGPYLATQKGGRQSLPMSATGFMTIYRRDGPVLTPPALRK